MSIRQVRPNDYEAIIKLIQHRPQLNYGIKNLRLIGEPDKRKFDIFFSRLRKQTIGWVKEDDKRLAGICMGAVIENFWDSKKVGQVMIWYVEPEFRGVVAIKLLLNVLNWFKLQKVEYTVGYCDFDSEAGKVYRRLGFQPLEETLCRVGG